MDNIITINGIEGMVFEEKETECIGGICGI
jgi:hypothetical protein